MFIYKITNTTNGKIYIGKTERTVKSRWKNHISNAKKGWPQYLYNAIRKYGKESFIIESMSEHETQEELCLAEMATIQLYHSNDPKIGYNMTDGGEGVCGLKWSEESRQKLSKSKTGTTHLVSDEHRKNLSEAMKKIGHHPSEEACRKGGLTPNPPVTEQARENYRKAWVIRKESGWTTPPEAREKMRLAKLGKKLPPRSDESKQKMREIAIAREMKPPLWACSLGGKIAGSLPKSPERNKKISEALTGKKLSPEHRLNLSKSHIGIKMPPCTESRRQALRDSWTEERRIQAAETARRVNTGRKASDETRKKLSEAHTGVSQSLESRQKKSESLKRFHENKRSAESVLVGAV